MNRSFRYARAFAFSGATLAALIAATPSGSEAKPALANSKTNTLTFRVLARLAAKDMHDGSVAATQNFEARVFAKGARARVETIYADRPMVLLLAPPYMYRLLPQAKRGVRYKIGSDSAQVLSASSLAALLRDPMALRTAILRGGGKRTGVQTLNGQRVELWTANKFAGQTANVKAWLRAGDSLPARLLVTSRGQELSATWRDYRKNAPIADSLFSIPPGFRVREAQDNVAPL